MATIIEKLDDVVKSLTKTKNITAVAVVARDGLLMVSNTKFNHAQTFAAMAATMFIAAETATIEIGGWMPDSVVVKSNDCKLLTVATGSKALLVALTEANANLGIALHDMKNGAEKVKDVLS